MPSCGHCGVGGGRVWRVSEGWGKLADEGSLGRGAPGGGSWVAWPRVPVPATRTARAGVGLGAAGSVPGVAGWGGGGTQQFGIRVRGLQCFGD